MASISPTSLSATAQATARDAALVELDRRFPAYGFARNKGYGTPEHLAALAAHGPCEVHRRSFARVLQTSFDFDF